SVLVLPERLFRLTPAGFLRIPLEGLALVGLALLLPSRWVRVVATVAGAVLGLVTVVRIFDLGFRDVLHRPVNPVNDWRLFGPAVDTVQESFGPGWAKAAVVLVVLVVLLVPVAVTLSVVRVFRTAARRRRISAGTAGSLGVVWLVSAVVGVQVTPGVPLASRGAAELAVQQVHDAARNLGDRSVFRAELAAHDPWSTVPAADLLTGLRGKDVIFVFVESYGRVAVQDSPVAPDIRALLGAGTDTLRAAGFSARSAFLTSSTFGGFSWLAHGTLHSGLWVDSHQRYDQLLSSDRFTLPAAFERAGWRTVLDVPSNRDAWPEGRAFYRFDEDYDRSDVGYEGPKFSYAAIPDQYTLAAFERLELAPGHGPVMAEIDLVSSHEPWTPLPRLVDWDELGDGSVFDGMPADGPAPEDVIRDPDRVRALYGQSIEYALSSLFSFVTTFHGQDDDLVLVVVGDHQPASIVSGPDATHDVTVTILAADPAVLDRISSWGWDDGMLPSPDAPVWRMDAFRDRFLTAFGPFPRGAPGAIQPR
ncbi:MAG: sulfatase-like hydrolase/transferase, partial [Actinomycetes bacterium]